jgi:hypothetical protein
MGISSLVLRTYEDRCRSGLPENKAYPVSHSRSLVFIRGQFEKIKPISKRNCGSLLMPHEIAAALRASQ